MLHNKPLTLKNASREDLLPMTGIVFVLLIVAALLSPSPVWATLSVFLLIGVPGFVFTLKKSYVGELKLTSIIFPDGRLRLISGSEVIIDGYLGDQHWCTRHAAVLSYIEGGKRQFMVLIAALQNADDYRRLSVWLRQDFCRNTIEKRMPGIWPASRGLR